MSLSLEVISNSNQNSIVFLCFAELYIYLHFLRYFL